jgi:hypothetical protein
LEEKEGRGKITKMKVTLVKYAQKSERKPRRGKYRSALAYRAMWGKFNF